MPSVILALLEQQSAAAGVLDAAGRLADLAGNSVVQALVARTPPESTIMPTEEVLTAQRAERIRQQETARAAALTSVFEAWRQHTAHAAHIENVEAAAFDLVSQRGAAADFIVATTSEGRSLGTERPSLRAALFSTDRPVLLVPPGGAGAAAFGRSIAIAWRDDGRAIKAVLPALRLLTGADQVHLLQGVRDGTHERPLPAVFQEHGIAARMHVLPIGDGAFGQVLLDEAHALGADLLVMGAYGHNPLRELIFGGVTRYMLEHADLPVLMRH